MLATAASEARPAAATRAAAEARSGFQATRSSGFTPNLTASLDSVSPGNELERRLS